MAQETAVTKTKAKAKKELPIQLKRDQTSKAVRALLKHIATQRKEKAEKSDKRELIASNANENGADEDDVDDDDVFVWLILATKRHIQDKKRLKPGKIRVPHSLYTSPTASICLITVDPQRQFKDVIADEAFPADLRKRITRVIGLSKLRAKYKSYESRRQLFREHDIFLADDRVIPSLPATLGKVFYKSGVKRPVPVDLAGLKNHDVKEGQKKMGSPQFIADEITRALSSALVHLSPSTSTAIRVGKASWDEKKVVENIETVVEGMVARFVPRGWRNFKSLHIKGPNTTGLPLWITDELWMDEADVVDDPPPPPAEQTGEAEKRKRTKKRKRRARGGESGAAKDAEEQQAPDTIMDEDGFDDEVDMNVLLRQQRFKKQKEAALKIFAIEDGDLVLPAEDKVVEAPETVVAAS